MKQNLEKMIKEIQTLRETKGKEEQTFAKIAPAMKICKQLNDYDCLVTLQFESALVWQHIAMNELVKGKNSQDSKVIKAAIRKMEKYALVAKDLILKHSLKDRLPNAYRYLGRVCDYKGDYKEALKYYRKALKRFNKGVFTSLEVKAFIAYSTVMAGNAKKGMELAFKAYKDLHNSSLGKKLKVENYTDWTLWLTGIPTRQVFALVATNSKLDKRRLIKWLLEIKREIEFPTGNVTWGDKKFQFRIDEINKALDMLK